MIHLDTNYLIGLAVPGSSPAQNVDQWLATGEPLAASALAWTEFLNGPVGADEIALVESVIEGNLIPLKNERRFWPRNFSIKLDGGAVHGLIA